MKMNLEKRLIKLRKLKETRNWTTADEHEYYELLEKWFLIGGGRITDPVQPIVEKIVSAVEENHKGWITLDAKAAFVKETYLAIRKIAEWQDAWCPFCEKRVDTIHHHKCPECKRELQAEWQ